MPAPTSWVPGGPRTANKGWAHLARSAALEAWAMERLRIERDLEMIVLGHTHMPLLQRAGPTQWYANTGDWVMHRSYLRLARGCDPVLLEWDGGEA